MYKNICLEVSRFVALLAKTTHTEQENDFLND